MRGVIPCEVGQGFRLPILRSSESAAALLFRCQDSDLRRLALPLRLLAAALLLVASSWSASYYTLRLEDPTAVYLTADKFPRPRRLRSRMIRLRSSRPSIKSRKPPRRESCFIPNGTYLISRTINVWPGIRVIGYGPSRPVFLLAASTPGYQDRDNERYLIFFAGSRPGAGRGSAGRRGPGAAPAANQPPPPCQAIPSTTPMRANSPPESTTSPLMVTCRESDCSLRKAAKV